MEIKDEEEDESEVDEDDALLVVESHVLVDEVEESLLEEELELLDDDDSWHSVASSAESSRINFVMSISTTKVLILHIEKEARNMTYRRRIERRITPGIG